MGIVLGLEKDSDLMEIEEKISSVFVGKILEVSLEFKDQILKMIKILSGEMVIELYLQFLI